MSRPVTVKPKHINTQQCHVLSQAIPESQYIYIYIFCIPGKPDHFCSNEKLLGITNNSDKLFDYSWTIQLAVRKGELRAKPKFRVFFRSFSIVLRPLTAYSWRTLNAIWAVSMRIQMSILVGVVLIMYQYTGMWDSEYMISDCVNFYIRLKFCSLEAIVALLSDQESRSWDMRH